ncbi:YbdD/YjiX family protein [Rhodococcus sp. BP-252]|nr:MULTISPECIES: YbdD/YjiX family protein [unclassified Rhodococcus (in: high G+C Gram-positive bacteria)]MBY6411715.1 YbdD/YjiX family protein [Rhodococcus sp. BP-320]MBY6417300.1 YbdD/YjiX family protein [Rhodococcus sp. BP-321]MBY6421915.1 YbdD/YjiX family protein [Rhodococcus sp. BP-324]MBY6427324.1 YbdD/YjiX family protein [Rhodococcus sp. BP-323]MBY6432533.1 YbdD/YjiX family protein [Rhodococcus sp. BP-322]
MTDMRGLWWWLTSVMGDRDYERFVAHMRRTHPGEPIQSERQYWRDRYAEADANPGARCC